MAVLSFPCVEKTDLSRWLISIVSAVVVFILSLVNKKCKWLGAFLGVFTISMSVIFAVVVCKQDKVPWKSLADLPKKTTTSMDPGELILGYFSFSS